VPKAIRISSLLSVSSAAGSVAVSDLRKSSKVTAVPYGRKMSGRKQGLVNSKVDGKYDESLWARRYGQRTRTRSEIRLEIV